MNTLTHRPFTLRLRVAWTIARSSSVEKRYRYVRATDAEGREGFGEAAHNVRYGESEESIERYLHAIAGGAAPAEIPRSGAAAVDLARWDLAGKREGRPLYALAELEAPGALATSHSIGIAAPETMAEQARALTEAGFRILKVKLGTENDRAIVRAIRAATDLPIRVDANEGWHDREGAAALIEWLAGQGGELVEQPLPAGRLEDVAWLRERSPLPLVADEDLPGDGTIGLASLAEAYDGINIKLMKVGGFGAALAVARAAGARGLDVMLGCMVESSLGTAAAAHLGSLARWIDLDGHLLVSNDPFDGLRCEDGLLHLPDRPGTGARMGVDLFG